MTCAHAETTTLLWLYGEGDEAHAAHVAGCPDCSAVAALHADVIAAVAPGSRVAREAPARARGVHAAWAAVAFALAAAVLLAVTLGGDGAPSAGEIGGSVPAGSARNDLEADALDLALDDLDAEAFDLALDLSTL